MTDVCAFCDGHALKGCGGGDGGEDRREHAGFAAWMWIGLSLHFASTSNGEEAGPCMGERKRRLGASASLRRQPAVIADLILQSLLAARPREALVKPSECEACLTVVGQQDW